MTHPLEALSGSFCVLVNEEGQYSLWPDSLEVPAGWNRVHGPAPLEACRDYVEIHWTDMRPRSLIRAMEADPASG